MKRVAVATVLAVWAGVAEGAGEKTECEVGAEEGVEMVLRKMECFKLYTACQAVNLVVEELSEDATEIGLTKAMIVNAGEARLRGARIYRSGKSGTEYLYIRVSIVGGGINIEVSLKKRVFDFKSLDTGQAETWASSSTGTHGRNVGLVLSSLQQHLDEFIANYLRVNEPACK